MTLCPFQAAADSGAGRHHARGEGALGISRGGVRGWRWNLTWATFWEVLWAKSRHEIKSYCHEISLISLGLVRSWTWLAKQNYCCETFWKLFGSLKKRFQAIRSHWTGTTSAYLHSQEQLEQGAGVQIGSCHRVLDKSSHQCVVEWNWGMRVGSERLTVHSLVWRVSLPYTQLEQTTRNAFQSPRWC